MNHVESGLHVNGQLVALKHVSVKATLLGCVAEVEVCQQYKNCEDKTIEAEYSFPLPENAALCKFEVEVDDKKIAGIVCEKTEAKQEYDAAVKRGDGAYLIRQDRPNIFTASVGNLLAGQEATLRFVYAMELDQVGNTVRFKLPSTISPRYISADAAKSSSRETLEHLNPPRVGDAPYRMDFSVNAEFPSSVSEVLCEDPVKISIDGKKCSMVGAFEQCLDHDIMIAYKLGQRHEASAVVALDGEQRIVMVSLFPDLSKLQRPDCEFVFVVDNSGSMGGPPIECCKAATLKFVDNLRDTDLFNLIVFGSNNESVFSKSVKATARNKATAREKIGTLLGHYGGTEIFPALKAVTTDKPTLPRVIVLLTDGGIACEEQCCNYLRELDATTFTVGIGEHCNDYPLREFAKAGHGCAEFLRRPDNTLSDRVTKHVGNIASLLLRDISIDWGGLTPDVQAPAVPPPLFDGTRLTLYARVPHGPSGEVKITAKANGETLSFGAHVDMERPVESRAVAALFARNRITDLDNDKVRSDNQWNYITTAKSKNEIIATAIQYQIMSPETSYLAIDVREADTQGDTAEKRVVPIAMSRGWGGECKTSGGWIGACGAQGPQGFTGISGPVGSGMPNAYPMAINSPLDRAYLRPFPQPLYDTEVIGNGKKPMILFQRPISQMMEHAAIQKELPDTNMNQSAMLDYPRQHTLTGVHLMIDPDATAEELIEIASKGMLSFFYGGPLKNPCVSVLLSSIPPFGSAQGWLDRTISSPLNFGLHPPFSAQHNALLLSGTLPLSDGNYFRHICPGEAFCVEISWKEPPKVRPGLRITVFLDGYHWAPGDPEVSVAGLTKKTHTDVGSLSMGTNDLFSTKPSPGIFYPQSLAVAAEDYLAVRDHYIQVIGSGNRPFIMLPFLACRQGVPLWCLGVKSICILKGQTYAVRIGSLLRKRVAHNVSASLIGEMWV